MRVTKDEEMFKYQTLTCYNKYLLDLYHDICDLNGSDSLYFNVGSTLVTLIVSHNVRTRADEDTYKSFCLLLWPRLWLHRLVIKPWSEAERFTNVEQLTTPITKLL